MRKYFLGVFTILFGVLESPDIPDLGNTEEAILHNILLKNYDHLL